MQKTQTKQVEISISAFEESSRPFFNKVKKFFANTRKYKVIINISKDDLV